MKTWIFIAVAVIGLGGGPVTWNYLGPVPGVLLTGVGAVGATGVVAKAVAASRKSPKKHQVRSYDRKDGTHVQGYERGSDEDDD